MAGRQRRVVTNGARPERRVAIAADLEGRGEVAAGLVKLSGGPVPRNQRYQSAVRTVPAPGRRAAEAKLTPRLTPLTETTKRAIRLTDCALGVAPPGIEPGLS